MDLMVLFKSGIEKYLSLLIRLSYFSNGYVIKIDNKGIFQQI